jgi:hypothetical protein
MWCYGPVPAQMLWRARPQAHGRLELDWLLLAGLGIMWVAFLVPAGRRGRGPHASVGDHERRMELLAQAETFGTQGRWIVTPRKGMPFMGQAERTRARARGRRRQVFTFLLEAIGITFLIGLVPPLRVMWSLTAVGALSLAAYVWLLLTVKHRASIYRSSPHQQPQRSQVAKPARAVAPAKRYVAEGKGTWARPTVNGLGSLDESDRVHVIVRTADQFAGA